MELRHHTKTNFGQCKCLWCGKGRHAQTCLATAEMRYAIKLFAAREGRNWKSKLCFYWQSGFTESAIDGFELEPHLRQFRNSIGPSQLKKITQRMLDRVHSPAVGKAVVSGLLAAAADRPLIEA